jgi:hypothetical protein
MEAVIIAVLAVGGGAVLTAKSGLLIFAFRNI